MIGASFFGMDITLAHPKGLDLDPKVLEFVNKNAKRNGGSFRIVHDMDEAFKGADVVYPKAWTAQPTDGKTPMDPEKAKAIFEANRHWITTVDKMKLTNDAIYMHCLPADRGMEVTDEVMDGPNSVIVEQAANRLHAQKGLMALIL